MRLGLNLRYQLIFLRFAKLLQVGTGSTGPPESLGMGKME
jgi:hypothetical protein